MTEKTSERKLREALETLHEELGRGDPDRIDPDSRELLETVAEELRHVLHEGAEDASGGLGGRVERAAVRFESEHPRLATTLNEVIEALARMGI